MASCNPKRVLCEGYDPAVTALETAPRLVVPPVKGPRPWRSANPRVAGPAAHAYLSAPVYARRCAPTPMNKGSLTTRTVGRFKTKEALRSRGSLSATLGELRGNVWKDPRYPVPTKGLCCAGGPKDSPYAHGMHAGGPTFHAFTPTTIQMSAAARDRYIRGLG